MQRYYEIYEETLRSIAALLNNERLSLKSLIFIAIFDKLQQQSSLNFGYYKNRHYSDKRI